MGRADIGFDAQETDSLVHVSLRMALSVCACVCVCMYIETGKRLEEEVVCGGSRERSKSKQNDRGALAVACS